MRKRKQIVLAALLTFGLAWAAYPARAQDASQSPPDAPTPATPPSATPASSSKDHKSKPPAPAIDAGQDSQTTAPQAPANKPSSAADNPFPEEVSKKAAADAKADAHAAAQSNAPATGSVKDPQGSSSLDGLDKLGLDDSSRKQLKLESPDGSPDEYDPKRATEDLRVGQFYLKTGDFKGAYSRFKDATIFDHENAEAIFWLAEAARKMKLSQEAAQNYQVYLAAMPDGPNAKTARKALRELSR